MQKYFIKWNLGYGDSYKVIEAESQETAEREAYEACKEDFEMQAEYSAEPLTPELIEDYDLHDEI